MYKNVIKVIDDAIGKHIKTIEKLRSNIEYDRDQKDELRDDIEDLQYKLSGFINELVILGRYKYTADFLIYIGIIGYYPDDFDNAVPFALGQDWNVDDIIEKVDLQSQ